ARSTSRRVAASGWDVDGWDVGGCALRFCTCSESLATRQRRERRAGTVACTAGAKLVPFWGPVSPAGLLSGLVLQVTRIAEKMVGDLVLSRVDDAIKW